MNMFSSRSKEAPKAPLDKFTVDFGKKYGEGGYGATFAAVEKATGQKMAVKLIDTRRMKLDAIYKECEILEKLTHPNVISVKGHGLGAAQHGHIYFIFMELAGGGELFDQVIDRGANAMSEETARGFFLQLIDGVAYCHLAGVAHRDLKLENVLLNEAGVLKLIDFGLSHVYPRLADGKGIDRTKPLRDVCGSKSYAAPEVLAGKGYDGYAADIWSIGVCLFAMLSGFFPLDEASPNDWRYPKLQLAQTKGESTTAAVYAWYRRSARHLSREVINLLDAMLTIEPSKRLTMDDLRAHPWVGGKKFGGVAAPDQGTFVAGVEVGDEGPTYRGVGNLAETHFDGHMEIDEEETPVYRSIGDLGADDGAPSAMPGLVRQRAQSNLQGPAGATLFGMAGLDALIEEGAGTA